MVALWLWALVPPPGIGLWMPKIRRRHASHAKARRDAKRMMAWLALGSFSCGLDADPGSIDVPLYDSSAAQHLHVLRGTLDNHSPVLFGESALYQPAILDNSDCLRHGYTHTYDFLWS